MKRKYGLALGSGGAKGIVHIGALQALEEEGLAFSYVSGTSIGSIIAGMYALGYTAREMIGVIEEMGLNKPKWLLDMKLKGVSLVDKLKDILGEKTFDDLKIPYKAVATDIDTGKEVIIGKGDLCLAMSASSAIPPAFKPVEIDGKRLVDGAFVNSIPADVCKKMGANYILGIDLSANNPMNFSALSVLNRFYKDNKIEKCSRSYNGYRFANVIIAPDLRKYNMFGVSKSEVLFDIGYTLVKNNINFIKERLKFHTK
ncbi:MAG: patatin-like phospholipase family protein [Clostridia bacterium]|nr:patatin-like phospholipase family protein [Clostridia bacterium]